MQSIHRPGARRVHRRGATGMAILLWLIALSLFVAPFLRAPDAMSPEGRDIDHEKRSAIDRPFEEAVVAFERDVAPGLEEVIAEASEKWFGDDSVFLTGNGTIEFRRVRSGELAYRKHCIGCHSSIGDGAGPAAIHLAPRPRNFRMGVFKFTSTNTGERPLRRDVFSTITRGLKGSSMPDFRLLSEELRWDLVEYVRYIAMRGEFQQLMLTLAEEEGSIPDAEEVAQIVIESWDPGKLKATYPAGPETEADAASIERGHELYLDTAVANCATCHGKTGVGDGPSAKAFNDAWGYPIVPRDLTTGVFRAGNGPEDLYRSIATGINGTPMTAYGASLSPEQIWDLVHFVQSLSTRN